jgi:hypothetical protein
VPAGADEFAHAPQRAHVVVNVFQNVVRDRRTVIARLPCGEHQLTDVHVAVAGEPLLERDQAIGLHFGHGHAGDVREPLFRVVAQPGTYLDRVVAQVGHREVCEPLAVVHTHRQALKDLGLDPLVAQDLRHPLSFPVVSHGDQYG